MRRRRSIRLLKCASTTLALLLAVADGNLGRAQRSSILGGSSQPPKWAYVGNAGDPPRIAGGGEVSASQAGSQRPDVECATLSQPLQAIAALPIQDDSIFIRCATICASSSAGDVVILSTSALQTSCTCVFASAIASRVGLLDQSLCNARCGSTVNLPCGSTLSSTTVSIYSLPSLVAFLERNASGSNDQSGDDTMDRPTAAAPRRRRSGLGPGPITAIVLGVAALVGIVVLGIVKFAHIRKRGYGRGYGSGDFADSYVTERGRQLSSSASTKQNYSSTSMGTGAGLVGSQSTGANVDTKSDLQGLPEIGAANGKKIDNRNESYAMPGSAQAEAPKAEKKDMGLYSEINDMGFFEDSIADAIMKEGKLHEPVKNTEDKGNSLKQAEDDRIDDAGVRAEKINRTLQNTTLSRPALVGKYKKSSTMPRKSPHAQVDNKFYTTARPSQSRHKKNKLSRSKSPQDKDGLKVKIREDFVIPRRDRNDQGVFTDEYLDAYKRKLFSERRAFDAAYSRDGDSDESKHDSLQSKSLSLRQFTISRAVPQNDIQSRHNTPRHKEDAYDNPQSTLRKVQSTLQREDATQDAAQGGGSPSEPHGGAHARLKEDPADFKASTDNPSIGTVPSSHSDDGKKDLDLNLPSKQPEPQTKPPEEDTGKSPFVYNDIPSSTSPGKHKIDPHKYNPIIVSKKQTPIDKRVTYLSMKLKSIQLTPDDEITEKNIDHNKTESISKVSGIEDSFIEGYAPGLAAYNPPKKNDETTAPESGDIDKVGALLDMGLSVEPDSKAKDKKELDNPYTETPAPASGVLQSEARSNGRYSENGNSSARRLSDSKEKKSPKTRSKRISSVFSKMSENVARRSSNIRDSLIKRLNENIASFPTKSSSSKNSQQESQNDYFIISESDSKQNT